MAPVSRRETGALQVLKLAQQTGRELEISWPGPMKRGPLAASATSSRQKIFARVGNPTQGQRIQSSEEEGSYLA